MNVIIDWKKRKEGEIKELTHPETEIRSEENQIPVKNRYHHHQSPYTLHPHHSSTGPGRALLIWIQFSWVWV